MSVWFTSDHHFNHANVIEYSQRPFRDIDDMTEQLIEKWNAVVKRGDTVYHLGDFCMTWKRRDAEVVDRLLNNLNGQKHLIFGNHDRDETKKSTGWHWTGDYKYVTVEKQKIVLFHYPIRSWRSVQHGSWHLHGHSHGNLTDVGGMTADVGVDCWDYAPVSFEQIKEFMSTRQPVYCDYHAQDSTDSCDAEGSGSVPQEEVPAILPDPRSR